MGIDFKNMVTPAMDICRGKITYKTISGDDLLAFKVDRVVSLERETPCWMVGQVVKEDSVIEKWVKNGIEVDDEKDLTGYRITLPMSQWENI